MLQSNLYSIFYPYFRKQFKNFIYAFIYLRTLFHLLTGILAAVCLLACDAKEPLPENQNTEIESPVIANDLSNQKVTAMAEDAQGHIWIGTFRGLNKYNVHEYHQYFCTDDSLGLPDNQITQLLRDSKNRFWVATVNGVCYIPIRTTSR